jgi:hypothetical protein
MDCATMSSDVIGDFQEPYGAVLVDWDDMAALPSTACESGAGRPAVTPIRRVTAGRRRCADWGWGGPRIARAAFRIIEILRCQEVS